MSDREWGQRIHEDSDALKAAEGAEADGACPSNDLKGLLNAIVSGHKQNRIEELMPWNFKISASQPVDGLFHARQ